MFDFKGNIEQIRELYKANSPKPKDRLSKPWWMSFDDNLIQIFSDQRKLYEKGNVFYGSLLQANSILFRSFPSWNCPADIVYSTDLYFDDKPQELAAIARELSKYKNTPNAPRDIKIVVNAITDENERLFNILLPYSITNGKNVYYTTIMVFRKHLPKKKLIGSIFPILTQPEFLKTCIILPQHYWTEPLKQYYCQR